MQFSAPRKRFFIWIQKASNGDKDNDDFFVPIEDHDRGPKARGDEMIKNSGVEQENTRYLEKFPTPPALISYVYGEFLIFLFKKYLNLDIWPVILRFMY